MTVPDTGVSNRERWKTLKYGIFSHYNAYVTGVEDVNAAANAFNAAQYAEDLAEAGVQYIVWTAWHANMFPSQTAARYGYGYRCSTRDTVSDMIDAVKANGIRVYLYTHPYQPLTPDLANHNKYINELYAELIDRYGSRIDGLWLDENTTNGTQDSLVDYNRLMTTIKERNPEMVTMQNGAMHTVEMGAPEITGSWNFGWPECIYNYAMPGSGPGMDDMLRTLVVQAAANFEGGGVHWSIDGVANGGLAETTRVFALGRYLAPIRPSICETTPSNSFPPPYKDGRTVNYSTVDWVATTSMDETKEFIHVLKAPAGKLVLSGSLNTTSAVTIASGAELEISGSLAASGNIVNNGTLVLTGTPQMSAVGTITNNGTIINRSPSFTLPANLVNNGTIHNVPAAPTGLVATPADAQVTLTWNPVSGATSYTVKQSAFNSSGEPPPGPWSRLPPKPAVLPPIGCASPAPGILSAPTTPTMAAPGPSSAPARPSPWPPAPTLAPPSPAGRPRHSPPQWSPMKPQPHNKKRSRFHTSMAHDGLCHGPP